MYNFIHFITPVHVFVIVVQGVFSCFALSLSPNVPRSCRSEGGVYLAYERYKVDVCARCYKHIMPVSLFSPKLQYDSVSSGLRDPRTNATYTADPYNASQVLLDTFLKESLVDNWKSCCLKAWECCDKMVKDPVLAVGVHCPRTWDGWQCWEDTSAGTTASQPCQDHIYFNVKVPSCAKYTHKECLSNGTWFFRRNYREWTNYSQCSHSGDDRRNLYFRMAMYVVTIVGLIPALVIFMMYKQLQVHRISMHKNLFASLLLYAACMVLFKILVIVPELSRHPNSPTVLDANGSSCKVLLILTMYFRMTNYMWMFCEGFYLHKLIAAAFAEQKNLRMFYAIGWALPVVPVSIYAIIRATLENKKCWAYPVKQYEWIMNAPNLMSLCANLFFLCNIIRILVTKLRATHANEPSQYRKAVRATLVLVPLFGLHFGLTIYRPSSGKCGLYEAYVYFNAALDGLQGFMVAVIFCYLNGEVLYLIKRSYQRFKLHLQMRSPHHILQSEKKRKWSATQESSLTDTQNHHHHHHHFHRTRHVENKLREINNPAYEKNNTESHNGKKEQLDP